MEKVLLSLVLFISSIYGEWIYEYKKDSFTDEDIHIFSNVADSGESKYGDKPVLAVMKKGDGLDVIIDAREFLSTSDFSVVARFDKGTATTYQMDLSTTYEMMYFKLGNDTTYIVYNLMTNAELVVGYIPYSEARRVITFKLDGLMDLANSKNVILSTALQKSTNTTSSTNVYIDDLKNKTYSIGWYFWMSDSGKAYLANGRDSSNGVSIWNFTDDNKWRPVHNASAFDGYPKADKVFDTINISSDGRSITIE